jgi:hypothetical protein
VVVPRDGKGESPDAVDDARGSARGEGGAYRGGVALRSCYTRVVRGACGVRVAGSCRFKLRVLSVVRRG